MLTTSVPIGRLDRKITIQEPVYTTNDHNEDVISSWTDVAEVWANVSQNQGDEQNDADRITYYETTIFTIRYRTGLNVRMRIIWDTVPYRIFSIREHKSSRKGYMEIAGEIDDNTTVETGGEFSELEFSNAEFNV
jgi:SPP1 family predicted phage head-tail adaptor